MHERSPAALRRRADLAAGAARRLIAEAEAIHLESARLLLVQRPVREPPRSTQTGNDADRR
jgi:hypothetical protein